MIALSSAVEISVLASRLGPEKRSCNVADGKLNSVGESVSEDRDLKVSRISLDWYSSKARKKLDFACGGRKARYLPSQLLPLALLSNHLL